MAEKERKNTSWQYNATTHKLTALYNDGVNQVFDLTSLIDGMTQQQELVYQYGVKQWLASNFAGCPNPADKRKSAEEDFANLVEKGIELFGEGKIGIIGKERANKANMDKTVDNKYTTLSLEEIEATLTMVKVGMIKLSAEMLAKVEARRNELKN
jgi:hypothetical protein